MLYNPATQELKRGAMELLDEWQGRQDMLLWADFAEEEPEQEEMIRPASTDCGKRWIRTGRCLREA